MAHEVYMNLMFDTLLQVMSVAGGRNGNAAVEQEMMA